MMNKKGVNKLLIFMAGAVLLISLVVFVIAEQSQSPQEELNQLENDLNSAGYSWLVNYSAIKLINNDNLILSNDNKILTY